MENRFVVANGGGGVGYGQSGSLGLADKKYYK